MGGSHLKSFHLVRWPSQNLGVSTGQDGVDAACALAHPICISSMVQIQLLIRPTAGCSPKLPVRWNKKVSAVRSQLGRSVSHRGKAHGRDRCAGNKYHIVTSPLGRQHEVKEKKKTCHRPGTFGNDVLSVDKTHEG